jgi:hypothetical protein
MRNADPRRVALATWTVFIAVSGHFEYQRPRAFKRRIVVGEFTLSAREIRRAAVAMMSDSLRGRSTKVIVWLGAQ